MTAEEILEEITSRDTTKVWRSSCAIISSAQNREEIFPLIKHLTEIKEKTKGLNMGGAFAPNQRFIDYAIKILEFHRDRSECTCNLYPGHETTDPNKEVEKGNIKIVDFTRIEGKWIDFYNAECCKCGQKFKVIEREYHYTWWGWEKLGEG